MIDRILKRLIPQRKQHLTDDELTRLFGGELGFAEKLAARRHLAECRFCRLRQRDLEESADEIIELYADALAGEHIPLPKEPRADMAQRFDDLLQNAPSVKSARVRLPKYPKPMFSPINLALTAGIFFSLATAVSFYVWWQQRTPAITSNALLVRAQRWDAPDSGHTDGVVYQQIQISTPKRILRRSIYRDVQRRRSQKMSQMSQADTQLETTLAIAGVQWNAPLSAADYQSWHDRQHEREDRIAHAGSHLLKLTTTTAEGPVAEQSLTVRDTDFHPVERTVAFRDAQTVEIAELDYKILPWSAVDTSLFEPFHGDLRTASDAPGRIVPFPLPAAVTEGQLDEAELSARLVLNQLHADTGEQIGIHRGAQAIEVTGVVETDDHKRQLQMQLSMVPHVAVSLRSVTELKNTAGMNAPTSIQVASMPEQRPPLAVYLQAHGHSLNESNMLAQGLYSTAMTIDQESKAIASLQKRFGSEAQESVFATATLAELIHNHRERLVSALRQERQLLLQARGAGRPENALSPQETAPLLEIAGKNLALAKELTEGNPTTARSAELILTEMSRTTENLKDATSHIYAMAQGNSTLSGKK